MDNNNKTTNENDKALIKKNIKNNFSAKRIALMSIFVALAFVTSILTEFSLFPSSAVFFLELDFGNVFILLISFLLGPLEGVIVCVVKELLRLIISNTGGVGEVANMITTCAFILLPSIIYKYRKGIVTVIISLIGSCILGTIAAILTNRFITFPLLLGIPNGVNIFNDAFWLIVSFNLIKTVSISILTMLLYKRLSNFLKSIKF